MEEYPLKLQEEEDPDYDPELDDYEERDYDDEEKEDK